MKYKILLLLFIIAFISSAILSFAPVQDICGSSSGCNAVQNSQYSEFYGIKTSYFGLLGFILLIGLTISHMKKFSKFKGSLIAIGSTIGAIFAIYFLYLQAFEIGEFCKYCLVADISAILSAFTIYIYRRKYKKFIPH